MSTLLDAKRAIFDGVIVKGITRLPVIVAIAFSVYAMLLMAYSIYSWRQIKADADAYLVADSMRRADVIADMAMNLRGEATALAELFEIHAYLQNRDLGMSIQYGLGVSLQAIELRFAERLGQHPDNSTGARIVMLDQDGVPLVDTSAGQLLPTVHAQLSEDASITVDAEKGIVVAAARIPYKGASAGTVIIVYPSSYFYRNLIQSTQVNQRELLITPEGRELPSSYNLNLPNGVAMKLASTPTHKLLDVQAVLANFSLQPQSFANQLVVVAPVHGLPLKLATFASADRVYGHLAPKSALWAASLVPVLLLWGAIRLDRMRIAAERLKLAVREAEMERLSSEQRSAALMAEISRREKVERALAESEERWELAIRGANDGIWDWQPKSGYVYFSGRWKGMLGLPADKNIDNVTVWESRIHPDDRDRVLHELDAHLHGKREFYQCEYRLRHEDGGYLWVLDRGKALFDSSGNALRMAGSLSDISDRRAAESHAQERREQLDTIFSLSPDGFVSFDAGHRVSSVNPAFHRLTELDADSVLGLDEHAFTGLLRNRCTTGARFRGVAEMRNSPLPKGRRELIELTGVGYRTLELALRVGNGGQVAQILLVRDVTAEMEVDQMKSEFLATAAHELRTPMASIYGYAELLNASDFPEDERKTYLTTIHRQAEQMALVINELLDLARIEARRGKDLSLAHHSPLAIVDAAISSFRLPVGRSAPTVRYHERALPVVVDIKKMQQVVTNLIDNAYKYSPAGGAVSVEFGENWFDGQNWIGFTVRDSGIGMTDIQAERIFDRFYRADQSGRFPGTGLGMSIVKEIIDLHQGRIEVDTQLGQGTSVTIWLPAAGSIH